MTDTWPEPALSRILDDLEREILAAPDDEITQVLAELGMRPGMKGSAVLLELRLGLARRRQIGGSEGGPALSPPDDLQSGPAPPIQRSSDAPRSR